MPETAGQRDFFYRSSDGLSLHAADYGDPAAPWLPVVCLPGLSRTARDFHELALHLSGHRHRPRRVVAFDYRGRGRSEWAADPATYNPLTEMTDVLDGMTALGLTRAVIVGTSRGGLIAMLMGVARPAAIAGVALHDVGPTLEPVGLARIKSYIGQTPVPGSWSDAAAILRQLHGPRFTALNDDDWDAFARLVYRDEDGNPVSDYDPALAHSLDGIDFDGPLPGLWKEFGTLGRIPVLVIRGENSDILSAATLEEMARVHPGLESIVVAGEGHAPLLRHALLQRISSFVTGIEGSGPPVDAIVPQARQAYDLDEAAEAETPG